MSCQKTKEKDNNKLEELKQNEEVKNDNKNLLIKFMALKNALIEERKKTSLLEKENNSLKEQIYKNNDIILELKDEIKKYHDCIDKKQNSNFFSELFNNINISEIKNEAVIEKLNTENYQLKEDLNKIKNELNNVKTELVNCLSDNNIKKIEYKKK